MRETQSIIERARRVSPGLQQLELSVESSLSQLKPGQSLFVRPQENDRPTGYLREQWLPVDVRAGQITVEISSQHTYQPGRVVSLLAPIGQPIPIRSGIKTLLMLADNALPTPFSWLARCLVQSGVAVTLVLNGRSTEYPLELFPAEVEIMRGDIDWQWPDQVETLTWADQIIALAPGYARREVYANLLRIVGQLRNHDFPENYLCGLFYQRLACGTGACQVCQIPYRGGDRLGCSDGPAFDLRKVILE